MHTVSLGLAVLLAVAIILIGLEYLLAPRTAVTRFGLPLPEAGPKVEWWLRLKGVRDIVSGLVVFAMMIWGGQRMVGLVLLVEAVIPFGDMLTALGGRGSPAKAFGIHGVTMLVMLLAGVPLVIAR
jgi:hypothetical protein